MTGNLVLIYNDGLTNSRFDVADLESMTFLSRPKDWTVRSHRIEGRDGIEFFDIPENVATLASRVSGFSRLAEVGSIIGIARGATVSMFDHFTPVPEQFIDTDGGERQGIWSYYNEYGDGVEAVLDSLTPKIGGKDPDLVRYELNGLPKPFVGGFVPGRTIVAWATDYAEVLKGATSIALGPDILARLFLDQTEPHMSRAEVTYLSCHTGLWDFKQRDWSALAQNMSEYVRAATGTQLIGDLFSVVPSHAWERVGYANRALIPGLEAKVGVIQGGHDSTVADIPAIALFRKEFRDKPFVHFQAGSWGMARLIGSHYSGLPEEGFERTALLQGDVDGNPVPTVMTPTGNEFDYYWGKDDDGQPIGVFLIDGLTKPEEYDVTKLKTIVREKNIFITPGIEEKTKGLGPFPNSESTIHGREKVYGDRTGQTAYIASNLETAICTAAGIELISKDNAPVVLSAGAVNDPLYRSLVATLLPDRDVYFIEKDGKAVTETTAYGGLMLAKAQATGLHPYDVDASALGELKKIEPMRELVTDLVAYRAEFQRRAA